MTSRELRQKYLDFFKSKKHAVIPSVSLVPENDSTTLFTGSGMQPMIPYLLGEKHPLGKRITDSQKCFRTQDIEEVGDNRHTTFFEMLGNWSLGDYFKKEQIGWVFEFLTKEIGLDPKRIYVTVFRGNDKLGIERDSEAVKIWQKEFKKMDIEAKDIDFAERDGMQDGRIFYYDETKNWWSRSGVPSNMPVGEPGGPDSEMFWDFGAELKLHENSKFKDEPCHVNCDCGRFLEIGNNVFMQYIKTKDGFELLSKGNIDFGGGLERLAAVSDDNADIFKTDLFLPVIKKIEELSGKTYGEADSAYGMRVIADHIKASAFMLSEGLEPSNIGRGYILRRLIRRAIRYGKQLGINDVFTSKIAEAVIKIYQETYDALEEKEEFIINQLKKEEEKFGKTLEKGLKKFMEGESAFNLYQTYGFPIEMTRELAKEKGVKIDEAGFEEEMQKHQDLSRTASAGQFKSGLADNSEQNTKYHTTAHLLLAALRKVLGEGVLQKGSNITSERIRFDFSYSQKMSDEQKQKVEDLVNEAIKKDLPVVCEEMKKEEAKEQGAMGVFEQKYGDRVKVYTIGDCKIKKDAFSCEICSGPHVQKTGELGRFKIIKEESSSSGVRRIKAVLE